MSQLTALTLAQARDFLRKREFSAVELTKAHVAAVPARQGSRQPAELPGPLGRQDLEPIR